MLREGLGKGIFITLQGIAVIYFKDNYKIFFKPFS